MKAKGAIVAIVALLAVVIAVLYALSKKSSMNSEIAVVDGGSTDFV
jgi:hypothetical protein